MFKVICITEYFGNRVKNTPIINEICTVKECEILGEVHKGWAVNPGLWYKFEEYGNAGFHSDCFKILLDETELELVNEKQLVNQ